MCHFYRFQKSYFSLFTSPPDLDTHRHRHRHRDGEKALHGDLACDEFGCCLLERGEVDLGSYRSVWRDRWRGFREIP